MGDLDDLIPLFITEGQRRLEVLHELATSAAEDPSAAARARRELHTLKGSSRMLKLAEIAELCHQGETLLQEPEDGFDAAFTEVLDLLSAKIEQLTQVSEPDSPRDRSANVQSPDTSAAATQPATATQPTLTAAPSETAPSSGRPSAGTSNASAMEFRPGPVQHPQDDSVTTSPGHSAPERTEPAIEAPAPVSAVPEEESALGEHRLSARAADELAAGAAAMRVLALASLASTERIGELALLAETGVTEDEPRQVLAMLSSALRQLAKDADSHQRRLLRHAEAQLDTLLDLQLQPLRPFLQGLARHARELARQLGKEVEVTIDGGEARLDQRIVSELRGAFLHLVRNSLDHGLEAPEARQEAGKRARGILRLEAISHGERVEIAVHDDGGGIDPDAVLKRARELDLVLPHARPTRAEILQLLFLTGFSTRREISEVSGRGVGLDAVATTVRQLGGDIWLRSEPGQGTAIHVEVPAARRGERVLVLRLRRDLLALPKSAVRWIAHADPQNLVEADGRLLVRRDGRLEPLQPLADILGLRDADDDETGIHGEAPLVLLGLDVAGSARAIAVDAVESEAEVLVRPMVRAAPVPEVYSGTALLPTGIPVAVLQPRAVVRASHTPRQRAPRAAVRRRLQVLLVEDSLVTREMERRMLEEEGFVVTATSDAEEALSVLGERSFDCMVTDLEMPGINGLELIRHVRASERLAQLPVIMVSTRDSPGDRLAGLEAGADAYLSKKLLESREIAGIIRRLGGSP